MGTNHYEKRFGVCLQYLIKESLIVTVSHSAFPVFEGAFTVDSDVYHIKTTPNYHISKRNDDPITGGDMVIYRDSDQQIDALEKRNKHPSINITCAMEELAYNRRMTGSHAAPSSNVTNTTFSNLWEKRSVLDVISAPITSTASCPTSRKSMLL